MSDDVDAQPDRGREPVVVGVDFGTLSGRALVVRVSDGAELGTAVHEYAHGVLDRELPDGGRELAPDWALQVPEDYLDVLRTAVPAAVRAAGVDPADVIGIATDFTACTMVPTTEDGTPLCDEPGLADEPHAYVKLWRHHAAQAQADRLNALARKRDESWLPHYGGLISSEWEFAKGLQILEEAPEVYDRMAHFVEAADWIVWRLSGRLTRNMCTVGYKGIYQDGRYPDAAFLGELDPGFADFATTKLSGPLVQLGERVGGLCAEAAAWTGLPEGVAVAAGNVDAHVTAPAAKAVQPGQMVAIMGTSTCHVMNGDERRDVAGMCGVVDGGVTEGLWGYEAGQSGVGDIFAWVVRTCATKEVEDAARQADVSVHEHLTALAARQGVGQHGLVALDWHSGNRSVLVDHDLSGLVLGLTLSTRPEDIYRALLEATAFGTRVIVEAFHEAGVPVRELIVAGGLLKNPVLMQIYADVLNLPLSVIDSDQGAALGSAIHAAVAAGAYPDVYAASEVMGRVQRERYRPVPADVEAYDALFAEYRLLHDYFGSGGNDVMHRLKRLRRESATKRSRAASEASVS